METIQPNRKNDWLNLTDNNWDELLPLVQPGQQELRPASHERTVFGLMSNGLQTKRDEWVYDIDRSRVEAKAAFLIQGYEATRKDPDSAAKSQIKWDADLQRHATRGVAKSLDRSVIRQAEYRPFSRRWVCLLYTSPSPRD